MPSDAKTYQVYLTDSYGDGWNNNVLEIRQNGYTPQIIGDTFTHGSSKSQTITLANDLQAEILVNVKGGWSYECTIRVVDSESGEEVFKGNGERWS